MSKNLHDIARRLLNASLRKRPLRLTTLQIQVRYGLNEQQCQKVKQYTKAMAAERKVLWGYDPKVRKFLVAPENAPDVGKRIVEFALTSYADAGHSVRFQLDGAFGMKFITEDSTIEAREEIRKVIKRTRAVSEILDWDTTQTA